VFAWIPPLRLSEIGTLTPRKSPFAAHADKVALR
jgi:hypothetical protein